MAEIDLFPFVVLVWVVVAKAEMAPLVSTGTFYSKLDILVVDSGEAD